MLRRVIGTPTPPPPPDAGSIPGDDKDFGGLTLADKLKAHQRNATCAGCHMRIDPLGFLQTENVMGFDNSEGVLLNETTDLAEEYLVTLQDGELVLRRNDGVTLTFRSATAGEFPEEAIQAIQSRRGISGEIRGDD